MTYEAFAQRLRSDHRKGARFAAYARDYGVMDLPGAYAAQAAHVAAMRAQGLGRPIGWKIGLTSKRMQESCGIDQPVAGVVLSSRHHDSGTTVSTGDYGRIGLEFEICLSRGRQPAASRQAL